MPAKAKVAMIVTAKRSLFHAVVPSVAAGNSEGRHDSQLHRERQTGGGRRSAADGGRQTRITQLAREGSPPPGLRLPQRNCHANPIRWLADGFPGSNPTCPASQSVSNASHMKVARLLRLAARAASVLSSRWWFENGYSSSGVARRLCL